MWDAPLPYAVRLSQVGDQTGTDVMSVSSVSEFNWNNTWNTNVINKCQMENKTLSVCHAHFQYTSSCVTFSRSVILHPILLLSNFTFSPHHLPLIMVCTTTKKMRTKRPDTRPNEKERRKIGKKIEAMKVVQDLRVTKKRKSEHVERVVERAQEVKQSLPENEKVIKANVDGYFG